jgi:MFS family permease
MFLLMAFTQSLHLLLLLRIIQGLFGGVSTTGIILVSSASEKGEIASNLGIFQSSITLGQLLGPPLGAFAAALLGYRNGFLAGAVFLFASFMLARVLVTDVPPIAKQERDATRRTLEPRIIVCWLVCLAVQVQLIFLPSVLPVVFAGFKVDEASALKMAGIVVMLYSGTSILGQFIWTRLSKRFGVLRIIMFLLLISILFQAALALTRGVVDFTLVRMLQTGFASAIIPLVISLFLHNPSGGIVGFLNAARFAGMAVGPLLATSVAAFSGLNALYLLISLITTAAFFFFKYFVREKDLQAGNERSPL